ncbi:DUF1804 family protein [Escherichia coli]
MVKCQTTLERLNQNQDIPPQESVELLASLSDSLSKAVASSKKILPETDRLATALEVVQRLGAYIKERHPAQYARFLRCSKASLKSLRIISVNHSGPFCRPSYSGFVMQKQIIGNATLYCGDVLDVLPALSERFDAVITDPPYSSGGTHGSRPQHGPFGQFMSVTPSMPSSAGITATSAAGHTGAPLWMSGAARLVRPVVMSWCSVTGDSFPP